MAGIAVKSFGGQQPRIASRLLAPNMADRSLNCLTDTRDLQAISQPVFEGTRFPKPDPDTLVAYYHPNTGKWLGWLWKDPITDFIVRPLPNDKHDRIYWLTRGGTLKVTSHDKLAKNGDIYSIVDADSYNVGVARPSVRPANVETTDPLSPGVPIPPMDPQLVLQTAYVFTYVDHFGAEGPPSRPSQIVDIGISPGELVNVRITFNIGDVPRDIEYLRLYRANSGAAVTDYQFVADIRVTPTLPVPGAPVTTGMLISTIYTDTKESFELGEVIPSEAWFKPPGNLEQVVLAGDGVLVGFKNNKLFFSEQYLPHAWPPDYYISLEHDIIALVPTAGDVVALTNGAPYLIGGALPASATLQKLDIDAACVTSKATVALGNNVIYAGTNGLISVIAGQAQNLTASLLTREQYHALKPKSMRMYVYGNDLVVTYNATSQPFTDPIAPIKGTMVLRVQEAYLEFYETYFQSAVVRPHDDRLFFIDRRDDVSLYEWSPNFTLPGAVSAMYSWTSKAFMFTRDIFLTCAQIDAESYPVEFELFRDDVSVYKTTIHNREVFRLPPGLGKFWHFSLSGTARIYQVHLADSVISLAADLEQAVQTTQRG